MRASIMLFCLCCIVAGDLRAQQPPEHAWALVPSVGFGWLGRRWSAEEGGNSVTLGPGQFPQFAVALERRTAGRFSYELMAGIIPTDYTSDVDTESNGNRYTGVGRLNLVRGAAGVLYRVRANAPGYFSVGAGGVYIHVVEPFADWGQESELAPSAHLGAGFDAHPDGATLRFDGRFHFSRGSNSVESSVGPLEPRLATDFIISIGYLFGL